MSWRPTDLRLDSGAPDLSSQRPEGPRVWAEGIVSFGPPGEPLVAQFFGGALPAAVPHLFHDGVRSWVTARGHFGVHAAQCHHVHHAPGRLRGDKRQREGSWLPAVRINAASPQVQRVGVLFGRQIKFQPIAILSRSDADEPHRLPMEKPETLVRRTKSIDLTRFDTAVETELVRYDLTLLRRAFERQFAPCVGGWAYAHDTTPSGPRRFLSIRAGPPLMPRWPLAASSSDCLWPAGGKSEGADPR